MIWMIRNLCIRFWITAVTGIPAAFAAASLTVDTAPGSGPVIAGALVIILFFFIIDSMFHLMGKKMISRLIKEGASWERAGIMVKSEQCYIKAVRVFDSFLLSPFRSKKTSLALTGSLARFMLTSRRRQSPFSRAVTTYLRLNPSDGDISLLWLKSLFKKERITSEDEELVTRLALVHGDSPRLLPVLTRFFLDLNRTDYSAQKVFRHALDDPALKRHFADRINALIDIEKEAVPEKDMQAFQSPATVKPEKSLQIKQMAVDTAGVLKKAAGKSLSAVTAAASFILLSLVFCRDYVKEREKVQFILKTGITAVTGIFLTVFIITTVTRLVPPKTPKDDPKPIEIPVPKPFTIQVAAYLKQAHAGRYVDRLEKHGITARIKQVEGGGKTWFLVMVSEFENKSDAARYGRELKEQGIIDDFFVNNK